MEDENLDRVNAGTQINQCPEYGGDSGVVPMCSKWQNAKLIDISAKKRWALNGGPFGSKLSRKHYSESGVPVIRGTNLSSGSKFSFDDFVYVSEKKADELQANNAHPGDLIFTQRGTIGQVGLIPFDSPISRFVISQSQMKLSVDPEHADPLFLYYFFTAPDTVQKIQNLAFAAGVPHINLDILRNFEIPVPPLPVQKRIASILTAYDDLIENCQRRIKILETMARSLYREWFVNFRFPGHENVPLVPSPLGDIPQGWAVKSVADSFEIVGGGTPSRKQSEYWSEGTIQWFSPSDLTMAGTMFMDDSRDHITELGLSKSSARLFPAFSVMLTSRATIGVVSINTHKATTNQGFITCLPNEQVPLYYLYHWVQENVSAFQRMASGATFKEISRGVFMTIEFLKPSGKVVQCFEYAIRPIADQIQVLQRQIKILKQSRALLLIDLLQNFKTY
jgi:type I restriction enzyme, S subunit